MAKSRPKSRRRVPDAAGRWGTRRARAGRPAGHGRRAVFGAYQPLEGAYDEVFLAPGKARPGARGVVEMLEKIGPEELANRQRLANSAFLEAGITFTVYSDDRGTERIFPFDVVPRIVQADEWDRVERGLEQRLRALNLFLDDVYSDQRILHEGKIPRELVLGSAEFVPKLAGVRVPGGVRVAIAGIDLVRTPSGEFVVLEDNVRTPSGVSYVLANRSVMKRVLPKIFANSPVLAVDEYPTRLKQALIELSPRAPEETRVVVLTPGQFNSAYFEHGFLARRMGCELVQGTDLFVHDDHVYVKTTQGPERVDVIYKRIDDAFCDPEAFRPDSVLGVPGLFRAYAKGHVALANALGNGVADDKATYPFVPEMIRFYLSEEPILGQVETLVCAREADLRRVLANLQHMVVKSVNASGGYGMLMGFSASKKEREAFAAKIRKDPRGYIAQPLVELSASPTWTPKGPAPRRVDLRPYVVTGRSTWVLPGGLTRVALVEGSYVVNSSQGGGSKDTWVLAKRVGTT